MQRAAFWRGMRDGAPFILVIAPFGLLFGVVAREAGWDMAEIFAMSVVVIAGASQFTALQLMEENAPVLIVILTATAVNLRHAMYSASMAMHLGSVPVWKRALVAYFLVDQTYGTAIARYTRDPPMRAAEKAAYFFGVAIGTCPWWYGFTILGAEVGAAIPAGLALDFAVPITFIALFAPALRSLPQLAAAFAAVTGALAFAELPYGGGLLVGAGLGMLTGAGVEIALERRR
jgi:4-azaleucine resistance transporter AzlC